MKKIIINLITLLIVGNAYSQSAIHSEYEEWKSSQDEYANFDIGKYFTPDIVRNQLPINLNLNSNYSHSNFNNKTYYDSATVTNYNFTGNFSSNFSHYVNTRKKISDFGIGLSLNENYTSQKTDQSQSLTYVSPYSGNVSLVNRLDASWSNKWYLSKKFFLNYNIYGGVLYNYTQNKIKDQSAESNQKQNEYGFNISPKLGIGYGRIENVEDARQAVYIANALSKRNILTRNLSNEELFELSQQISIVKNKRFLDSRLHLIDEISTVDSFFVKKELLNNTGAAYFTTLYDMWQYGALFPRKAGYEVSFLIYPYYTYDYVKNSPELQNGTVYYPHRAFLEADLAFNYEKPFKLNWQHSVTAGGYAYFEQGKTGETDFNSIFSTVRKIFSAWTNYSLSYYPNTRTNLQATAGQQIRKQIDMYQDRTEYTTYTPNFNFSIDYYLSPYLRVAGNFSLNYDYLLYRVNDMENFRNNSFYTTFNIQFIYSIF